MNNRIREFRKDAGLSLEALAQACGGSKGNMHQLEQGRAVPRLDTAYAIAAVLGRSVTDVWPDDTEVVEQTITVRRVITRGDEHG